MEFGEDGGRILIEQKDNDAEKGEQKLEPRARRAGRARPAERGCGEINFLVGGHGWAVSGKEMGIIRRCLSRMP